MQRPSRDLVIDSGLCSFAPNGQPLPGHGRSDLHSEELLHSMEQDDQHIGSGYYLMLLRQRHVKSRRRWSYRASTESASHA